ENVLHDLHWRLESIVEGAHVGTLEWNIQTGAMVFNDVWAENLGFTAAEVNFACSIWGNQTWEMFTHPDDVKLANEMLERHFSGELPYHDVECRMMHKDGHWVWIQQRGRVTKRTDDGKPLLMFGTHTDITVRKQVEESLRLSEEKYRTLIENMGEGVVFLNDEETFVFANQAAEKIFGVDKGELLGLCLYNFLPDKNIEIVKNQTQKRIQGESSVYEHEIVLKDGSKRYILVSATPSFDDKKFIGTFSIFRDITERKQAEVDLHVSEALYRNLVERLPDGIYKSTHEGKFIDANPALVQMLGYNSKEELMAIDIKKQLYFEEVDRESLILEEKQSEMEVFRLKKKDGSEIWVEDHGWYSLGNNEEILFHEGIMRDITERKLADNQLRKSRSEFKDLFDFAPIGYHEIDSHGNIVRINETELNMLGYSADELLGKHISMLSSDANQSRRAVKAKLNGTYVPLESFERLFRRKDGTTVPVQVNDRILKANDGSITGIRSVVQDITEFKLIDKAMRESELKFRHYIDFAPHGVFVTDDKGNYVEVNSAASKITGYSKTELLAMNSSALIAEESTEKFVSHIQRVVTKGYASDEYAIIKKDKTIRFCTLDSVKLSDNRFLGFVVDITDRKQAEEVLRESEIFLKEIQTIAQLGNCTIDIISGKWEGSEILDSILGIDTAYEKSLKGLTSLLKPEWLQSMTDYFLNEIVQKQVKFDKKFKIIRLNDKEERWLHGIGELKFNNFNQPVNMIITIQDITERKLAKETLQNERLLLRSIIDIIPDSIYTKDLAGHKTLANRTEVRFLKANTEADVLGKDDFDFYAKELADKFYENDQMVINTGKPLINKEEYIHDENGQKRWVLSSKLPLRDKDNQIIGLLGTSHDITIRKSMEEALSETQEQLKKFAAHLQNVREEERIGLAREIHDELGQILIAIKIDVGMLKQKVLKSVDSTAATDILTKFDSLFGLVDNTINTARKIMTDLRPEVLYLLGFIESAKLQTSNFQERHHISCKFESTIPKLEISSQKSVAMFRILQEALNNIAKHARATDVNVKLTDHSDILILEIKDNGIGFDVDQKGKLDSYGLIGMKERAFLLDAELIITADATKGTCIRVEMPYSEKIAISE
ncbi:MAG TPA: PAS domain S-box protein, partial [Paludibacter sp.]